MPRDPALAGWEGCWVAVKDGVVIASGPGSGDLARALRALPPGVVWGCSCQFVPFCDGYTVWVD